MKLQFSNREKITFALVLLILVLYVVLLQFYFLSPLKTDLKSKQQTLQSEQKLLEALQKKGANNQTADANTTELQKEVPVKPLQDQFILDLQQAEAVSNSQIKSMSFAEGGQAAAGNTQPSAATNTSQTQTQTNTNSNTNQNNTSNSTSQQAGQKANGASGQQNTSTAQAPSTPAVSKLTVQLSIQSPNYEDLEKFINTLEGLKRITVVEAINYTGNQEIKSLDQNNKPMDYSLTISAYYLPGLTDLDKQLPKADFPAPANKENPLSKFASTN